MAVELVTEDGTGLATATTYCGLDESNQHFENTGRKAAWTAFSATERSAALNAAARYMDDVYAGRYVGKIQESTRDTQALLWPREDVPNPRAPGEFLPADPIPTDIHRANAEFALAFLQDGNGTLFALNEATGAPITELEVEVVGAVKKREKFGAGGTTGSRRKYPAAAAALANYLTPSLRTVMRI